VIAAVAAAAEQSHFDMSAANWSKLAHCQVPAKRRCWGGNERH
jgi:hypothetical protein